MRWDRFDICEAYYLYAVNYHRGQYSREYKIFGRLIMMGFKPGIFLNVAILSPNARAIYDNLVENGMPGESCVDRIITNYRRS